MSKFFYWVYSTLFFLFFQKEKPVFSAISGFLELEKWRRTVLRQSSLGLNIIL